MRLEEALEVFLEARLGVVSPQTTAWYSARLGRMLQELGGSHPVGEVTLADLRHWRAALLGQESRWHDHPHVPAQPGGLAAHTADGHWRAARTFFRWLFEEGLIAENPAARLERPQRAEVPPKRMSRADVTALIAAAQTAGPREAAMVRFLLATGVRAAECVGMLRSALELDDRYVLVHGKGNKSRVVCFDAVTERYLRAYLATRVDTRPAVWLTHRDARALTIGGLRSSLRKLCERARIAQIGPHTLRHTFAYEFLRAGGDPDLLRRQLGHSRLSTTYDNYVRWLNEDQQRAFKTSWLEGLS